MSMYPVCTEEYRSGCWRSRSVDAHGNVIAEGFGNTPAAAEKERTDRETELLGERGDTPEKPGLLLRFYKVKYAEQGDLTVQRNFVDESQARDAMQEMRGLHPKRRHRLYEISFYRLSDGTILGADGKFFREMS